MGNFGEEYISTALNNFKAGLFGEPETAVSNNSVPIGDSDEIAFTENSFVNAISCFGKADCYTRKEVYR